MDMERTNKFMLGEQEKLKARIQKLMSRKGKNEMSAK